MRFGLLSFVQAPLNESLLTQLDNVLEQVHVAKESGFDSIFVGQHYLSTPYQMLQSIPLLARIAAEARDMRIGTSILLIPLLHPVDVAEQIATLDVIAGGKFVFGVGLGYRDIEYEAFGVSKKHSVSRFTEVLVVIKSLWTEGSVTFHGRHFTLNNVTMTVKPLQKPHPPIWIAANNDGAVARAARMADAWIANPHVSIQTLRRHVKLYQETLARLNKPFPEDFPIIKELYCAENSETAWQKAKPFLEEKYATYRKWGQDQAVPTSETFDKTFTELADGRFIIGNPHDCIEQISLHHRELGFNDFILRIQWPGMKQSDALNAIRLVGTRVIPYFRETAGSDKVS